MSTVGLQEAAKLLRLSPSALMRKARRGIVPGAKVGREWVFVQADLIELVRQKAKEYACRSIATRRAPPGGSASPSAESKLDARLRQLTDRPQRSSRRAFELISGASE